MKYRESSYVSSAPYLLIQDVFSELWTSLGKGASNVRKTVAQCMLRLKIARMQAALSRLTDEQLKQIDLKRSDIGQRAAYLITYEYDGL
ncbi:hypothetical protein DL239_08820 [Sedimentitalea sp. CY04]|uniref:DUF1127 domain-containing protein n=1 Tax=Parasedimentitalea denitrificans TaxID=2211118 RepID=A0ABX0W8V4_9RHOB|nr:hypothetical protein [Sedimentitalea sp. CY04]